MMHVEIKNNVMYAGFLLDNSHKLFVLDYKYHDATLCL